MTDNEFNKYIGKYSQKYITKTSEDGCRIIPGKYGEIGPYSPEKRLLGVWSFNHTTRRKRMILQQLSSVIIDVHQDCDNEFGAYFDEDNIDIVAEVICAKKRRNLSDAERRRLGEQARRNFGIG